MLIDITNPASIFGFAGVLANFCWPMMRERSYLLAGQVVACCFMLAHFALIGAYTGANIMGVAGFQAALAIPLGKNPKFKLIYLVSLLLTPAVCYATWQGVQSIFSSFALAIVCIANFQLNEIHQRALLITAIFAWFAHNLVIGSVPGIISNALALMISSRMLFIAAKHER
jgi:Bacterial inner membrane protein